MKTRRRFRRTTCALAAAGLLLVVPVTSSATGPPAPPIETSTGDDWREQITAACDAAVLDVVAIPVSDGTAAGIEQEARAMRALYESDIFSDLELPAALGDTLSQLSTDAIGYLDDSIELAEAGDLAAAQRALDEGTDRLSRSATAIAIAGARCGSGDPDRVENADLTVPLEMGAHQINTGFGSIWVSENLATHVVRLDRESGAILARIDVGERPQKLQPADGKMWVRTATEYVAIDPATNSVTSRLAKSDVGPAANRNWAVDGAMWICDGHRLHRYDPTTLAAVTTLDVGLSCDMVYAESDLVVAWSYNEDPGESGTSAVTFVDPATDTVLATLDLPVDVGAPALLPDAVFLHGLHGSTAVVVDRATWTVTATPDLGIPGGGTGQAAFDGESIYVATTDNTVLRVDSATFEVTDTIEPLGVSGVVVDDTGSLWVAQGQPTNVAQRFDLGAAGDGWRTQVAGPCDDWFVDSLAIAPNDGSAAGIAAEAAATKTMLEHDHFAGIDFPVPLGETLERFTRDAVERLDDAIELAGSGVLVGAQRALDEAWDRVGQGATAIAIAGAECGLADPARVDNADLTVPLEMDTHQLATGFGSVWVSEELAGRVVRLDPETGAMQATVDVGERPLKLQPADGMMWVRTAAAYVAIDPATDTIVATLAKADVGPEANRSWAVDGAMWICDGERLHRYDPTTLAAVATLDLEVTCGAVYAEADLVVAWSYDENPGESGTSAAAFVDPATNAVLATVHLPVDVGGPALLGDSAFFHGYGGSTAVVVDRTTWTITATPDLGVAGGGTGQAAFDGTSIYVVTADRWGVLRVDSTTFEVIELIEPLVVNAVAIDGSGSLWVAGGVPFDVVQRFDVDEP